MLKEHPVYRGYKLTKDGRVWSDKTNRFLSVYLNKKTGRFQAFITDKSFARIDPCGKKRYDRPFEVSWLVWETYMGPRTKGMHICHNDNNPHNNHISNLREDTPSGNNRDKSKPGGVWQVGCLNNNHKLIEREVFEIDQYLLAGKSRQWLAAKYSVSEGCIRLIELGKTWSWLLPHRKSNL